MSAIHAHGQTDTGLARRHNEDCFGIDGECRLYVVADGMGGHTHGEVASRIAVDSICEFVGGGEAARGQQAATGESLQPHSSRLKDAIHHAHEEMLAAIREDLSLQGMGTTVAGLMVSDDIGAIAHVGDSRVYRLRSGKLELMTCDHTWVNEQVMAGYLSEEQARSHPLRNVVTRALGGETEVVVDVKETRVQPGDIFLICSDGLTGMLTDLEIRDCLLNGGSLESVCRDLIDEANARGGLDNITVVLAQIEDNS